MLWSKTPFGASLQARIPRTSMWSSPGCSVHAGNAGKRRRGRAACIAALRSSLETRFRTSGTCPTPAAHLGHRLAVQGRLETLGFHGPRFLSAQERVTGPSGSRVWPSLKREATIPRARQSRAAPAPHVADSVRAGVRHTAAPVCPPLRSRHPLNPTCTIARSSTDV